MEKPTLVELENKIILILSPQVGKNSKWHEVLGQQSKQNVALDSFVKACERFTMVASRSFQQSKDAPKHLKGLLLQNISPKIIPCSLFYFILFQNIS